MKFSIFKENFLRFFKEAKQIKISFKNKLKLDLKCRKNLIRKTRVSLRIQKNIFLLDFKKDINREPNF